MSRADRSGRRYPTEEDTARAMRAARIQSLKILATNTHNPIYVWEAILYLLLHREDLPDWAIEEVKRAAYMITAMAKICAGENWESPNFPATLTGPQALGRLAEMLALAKGTWNAFSSYVSDAEHIEDLYTYEAIRFTPVNDASTAVRAISARRKMRGEDLSSAERSVKRRISKAKRITKPEGG